MKIQSTPLKNIGNTEGTKDYSDVTAGEWYASTDSQMETGQLPSGASMHRVLGAGNNTLKELTKEASMQAAQLRDWQSSDQDVYDPIYVRTAASSPQSVSYTGSPSISTSGGATKYSYSGTTSGNMNVHTYDGSGNTVENNNYTGAYTVDYTVSSATRYTGTLYSKASDGSYYVNNQYFYTNYKKSTLTVTGTDTGSGSAKLVFTPKGQTWYSGAVTVTPYTPETVAKKVFQQAVLTPAETTDQKWGFFTRVPGGGTENTKTFLVQSGSNAIQNFAFDMDETDL